VTRAFDVDVLIFAATLRIARHIDERCEYEHERTVRQGKAARRAIGQWMRRNAKGPK